MAARKNAATPAVNADGTPKVKRALGPKKLYIILNEGVDVTAFRGMIADVTFSGQKMLKELSGGTPKPFYIHVMSVEEVAASEAPAAE